MSQNSIIHSLSQFPLESRKKPDAHAAHWVPFDAEIQPGRQVHWPLAPHSPLAQLQLDGGFVTIGVRQRPVPVIPS